MPATSLKVLALEPDPIVALGLRRQVLAAGHRWSWAIRASDGLHMASDERPDLILINTVLDGVRSGVEAAHALRRQARCNLAFLETDPDAPREALNDLAPLAVLSAPPNPTHLARLLDRVADQAAL